MAVQEKLEAILTIQDNASKSLEKIQKQFDELEKSLKKPQKPATETQKSLFNLQNALKTFTIAKVAQQFAEVGKYILNSASDMVELENVTEQVFGAMTKDVQDFAKRAGEEMGRSTYAMTKYVSDMGAVIKGLGGFDNSQIKKMSEDLATLAVDIGSFKNVSDEEVFNALRGGIVGETESLKRLGIVVNDTVMAQYALSKGYKESWQNLDVNTKTMLRYQAIMEKTTFMHGDAARTINSFANQLKVAEANANNLAVTVGSKFIGASSGVLKGFNEIVSGLNSFLSQKKASDYILDFTKQKNELKDLANEYINLSKEKVESGLTNEKEKERLQIYEQLISKYPELKGVISKEAEEWNKVSTAIQGVIDKLGEKMKAELNADFLSQVNSITKKYDSKIREAEESLQETRNKLNVVVGDNITNQLLNSDLPKKIAQMVQENRGNVDNNKVKELLKSHTEITESQLQNIDSIKNFLVQIGSTQTKIGMSTGNMYKEIEKEQKKYNDNVKALQRAIDMTATTVDGNTIVLNGTKDEIKAFKTSTESQSKMMFDKQGNIQNDILESKIAILSSIDKLGGLVSINGSAYTYSTEKTKVGKYIVNFDGSKAKLGKGKAEFSNQKDVEDFIRKNEIAFKKQGFKYEEELRKKVTTTNNGGNGNGKGKDKKGGSGGSKDKNKWEQLLESLAKTEADLKLTPTTKQATQIKELSAKIRAKQDELTAWLLSVGELTKSQALDENIKHLEDELKNAIETKDSSKVKELREKIKSLQVEKIIPAIIDNIDKQLDEEINKIKAEDIGANKEDLSKLQTKIDDFRTSKLKQIENQKNSGLITQDEYIKNNADMLNKLYEWYKSVGDIDNTIKIRAEQNKQNIKQLLINQEQQEVLQSLQNVINSTSEEDIRTNYQNLVKTTRDNILNEVTRQFNALNDSNKAEILSPAEIMKLKDNDFKAYANKIKNSGNTSLISLIEALESLKETSDKLKKLSKPTNFEIATKSLNLISESFKALAKGTDSLTSQALNDIASLIDSTVNVAKQLRDGISQIKAGNLFSGISGIAGAVIGIVGSIASIFKPDEGKAKAEQEHKKALDNWSKTLSDSNKHLRDSIDNLKNEVSNFQKTLIKNIASNTSTKNLTMNENIAKELALMYANSFDATIKTTVSRTKESYSWFGLKRDTQYLGTETKEESLRKIMNLPNFKNANEILSWYEKHKNDSYSANFENLGSRHGFITGYSHTDKLVGSNFKDAISMIPVFANNVKQIMELNKNIKQYGVLESFEGVNVTSIGEQKEQLRNILKKLVESSGQDYYKVANSIEEKLNELIKQDDVIVTAFDDVRNSFTSNLSKGNSVIDSLANGLQGYFDKLRANLAKVKYDLEFRDLADFEKEFTEKFDKISKSLAKLRLENGKTLKDLDPKELDFNDLFKKLTTIDKTASDMRAVIQELRNQAKAQGLSDEIIDQMLPLDKVTGKAQEIANALKNAMTSALNTNSFNQFSMTLGESLYTIVRDNLVQAFADSTKYKELFEKYTKTAEYEAELNKASTIRQAYDVIQSQLKRTENMLKAEGLDFRSTIASNGEYNGGFMNRETIRPTSMLESGGININTTVNIDNKGFLAIDDLTNTLTDTIKEKIAISKEREV